MKPRHDPEHDAVCASAAPHVLVVAPPGTGKTYLAVRLAASIAPSLAGSEKVLLLTFSNQARTQLEHEAARQLCPGLRRRVRVANYHAFFWRAVWAHRRALGLPLDAQIGSRRRRLDALRCCDEIAVRELKGQEGLLDSLAELRFDRFHDDRTPDAEILKPLLDVVDCELRAGRLVFEDLGALFWKLLETYPVVAKAYADRYPVVIADEHQDASELQDALVRRFGRARRVILADPMQLIYGFRGSNPERLDRHAEECDERHELRTPHRWHGDVDTGRWLLAVRARLQGEEDESPAPAALQVIKTNRAHGLNAMKPHVRTAAARAFADGLATVAVLAAWNSEVADLRGYLSRQNMFPRQLGGGSDFDEAREDIECLPRLGDAHAVARHAIERVRSLVQTLRPDVVKQVQKRLGSDGVKLSGRCGDEARDILGALVPLYKRGAAAYVTCVVSALEACAARGHHLPRVEAVGALRSTADACKVNDLDLEGVLTRYADGIVAAAHAAPRIDRGLFVMTAHQSKGKEFDAVILANVGGRQFPDDDESRRLFYVSITRGSKRWVVIAPNPGASNLLGSLGFVDS